MNLGIIVEPLNPWNIIIAGTSLFSNTQLVLCCVTKIHAVLFQRLENEMYLFACDVGYNVKPADERTPGLASSFLWMNPKGA